VLVAARRFKATNVLVGVKPEQNGYAECSNAGHGMVLEGHYAELIGTRAGPVVASGNGGHGIFISGAAAVVRGALVGVTPSGSVVGNTLNGITIESIVDGARNVQAGPVIGTAEALTTEASECFNRGGCWNEPQSPDTC